MATKLMVIDDEAPVCEMLRKLFTQDGYEVAVETDSTKAVQRVTEFKPNCILMDVKMPRVGGVDVLAKVKAIDPRIGVIMITGYGDLQTAMESMKLGAYDYITKPFELDFIKNLVKTCLAVNK